MSPVNGRAWVIGVLLIVYANCVIADDTLEPSESDAEDEDEMPEPPAYKVPEGVQTLSFNPGNLTDEDQHSAHMPMDLKCDGCRVIAYVMKEQLKKMHSRYKKGHRFSEMDVVDLFDKICVDKDENFHGYGIKEIMGVRRLSGEGLETKDVPGVMQGGGQWPNRLKEMCFIYLGEVGEDVIYETFIKRKSIENLLCRDKMGNICPSKKKKKAKKAKKGKKEKKDTEKKKKAKEGDEKKDQEKKKKDDKEKEDDNKEIDNKEKKEDKLKSKDKKEKDEKDNKSKNSKSEKDNKEEDADSKRKKWKDSAKKQKDKSKDEL